MTLQDVDYTSQPDPGPNGWALMPQIANALHEAGQLLSQHDPLRFPMATASALRPAPSGDTSVMYEIPDQIANRELFKMLTGRNVPNGAGGQPLSPVILFFPRSAGGGRNKRMASNKQQQLQNVAFEKYLSNNCRIRTKTNQGTVVGDSLLVSGEMVRNPIRAAAEKIYRSGTGGGEMPDWLKYFTEGANIVYDIGLGIMTLGTYPAVKFGSAKALTIAGHAVNGENTCLKHEFSPEDLAQLLFDTEIGITNRRAFIDFPVSSKPSELRNIRGFQPDGIFVHEYTEAKLSTVKYMQVNHKGFDYLIREKNPGEYWTFHPHSAKAELVEKRVYFDSKNNKIHFDREMPEGHGMDYDVVDGKRFVEVNGENYEVTWNWERQKPEFALNRDGGEVDYIPAYMEPLSKTWHLSTHNGHPAFRDKQEELIGRISVEKDGDYSYIPMENLNQQYYGTGKIYRAEKTGDYSHYTYGRYIEMNGNLVPVRDVKHKVRGVLYEVYDATLPNRKGYPVEWDGRRWLFERPTSAHVSKRLEKIVTPEMFEKGVDASELSAPDHRGLRWDSMNNSYIKIKGNFVKILSKNNLSYIKHKGNRINLSYDSDKFKVETLSNRLQRVRTTGLSGRGNLPRPRELWKYNGENIVEISNRKLLSLYEDAHIFSEKVQGGVEVNVVAHGAFDFDESGNFVSRVAILGNEEVEAGQLAGIIESLHLNNDQIKKINLPVCHSADFGENSLAAELSKSFPGVLVEGYAGTVTSKIGSEYVESTLNDFGRDMNVIPQIINDELSNFGITMDGAENYHRIVFKDGRMVEQQPGIVFQDNKSFMQLR